MAKSKRPALGDRMRARSVYGVGAGIGADSHVTKSSKRNPAVTRKMTDPDGGAWDVPADDVEAKQQQGWKLAIDKAVQRQPVTMYIKADILERARNAAAAHRGDPPEKLGGVNAPQSVQLDYNLSLTILVEHAIVAEVNRLARRYHDGKEFPLRPVNPHTGKRTLRTGPR